MSTEKTVETLQEEHTDMLATAYDIGLEVPDELKANFTDAGAGAGIVSALDALIREQQGAVLANDDEGEHTGEVEASSEVQAPPKKPRKKPKKATAKMAEASSGETEVAIVKEAAKPRKAPAKKAAPTKKAAKKAPGKKASASARTKVGRVKYEDNQKIVKLGENPSDPKSGRGQRIANVLKHSGKTYKTYRASGGKDGTLNWCVKAGIAKVA